LQHADALNVGAGHGPVDHFWRRRDKAGEDAP
jgi:hypothetical protein